MNLTETTVTRAADAATRLNVRSALNPALWLCGLVTVPCVVAGAVMNPAPYWLVGLAISPVAVALFGFLFLLFADRDRLQSESYQLRKQALEMIEEKGVTGAIDASAVELISNPDLPALPKPKGELPP